MGRRKDHTSGVAAAVLAAVILALYARTAHFGYVFDDEDFIVQNPLLSGGISSSGVLRAFGSSSFCNWHPLTWLSHMLDVQLFGFAPGPAHLVNAALHAACALALLFVLRAMTGALWASVAAAAFFALHPLRVESVAWITERKDALSTLLWVLAMGAWTRHARRPGAGPYALAVALFALALMSKSMVVTFPFVLLVLDWWPLARLRLPAAHAHNGAPAVPAWTLLLEKIPFLVLAGATSVVTFLSQRGCGAVQAAAVFPVRTRLANALVSSVAYLGKVAWPRRLAVFYPHPGPGLPAWKIAGSALLLLALTAAFLRAARARPALAAGWLWYLGTLVPVIGIVQVGAQAMADRYTYLPGIGLCVALAWGPRWRTAGRRRTLSLVASATAALGVIALATWNQLGHWRDEIALYTHAIAVNNDNWLAHNNLASILNRRGDVAGQERELRAALRIRPYEAVSHFNLATVLKDRGRTDEARAEYHAALALNPRYADALYNLGLLLATTGRLAEAEGYYRQALHIRPDFASAHINLGILLASAGRLEEAVASYRQGLRLEPRSVAAHMDLGNALADLGRNGEALEHYDAAVRLAPGDAEVRFNRGRTLEESRLLPEAAADYREALRLRPGDAEARAALERLATQGMRTP